MRPYTVSRDDRDLLTVWGEHGDLAVMAQIHPTGRLHPRSVEEARERPWFYTGSPFGAHIIGFMWERHWELTRDRREPRP